MPPRPSVRLLSCAVLAAFSLAAQDPGPIDPAGVPGARIVVGGGRVPAEVYARFVTLAGGESASVVLVPTASESADEPAEREELLARWRKDHPKVRFTVLHTRDRAEADREAFAAPLREAGGVWFGGGVQKRIADAYLGTRVEAELQALLRRGGVVGGTSAGAAIQSRTMIQEGNPDPILATGFDFVPDAVVDQHFLRRQRLPRLRKALEVRPGLFGLGVDEGTAVEVRGRELRVHGASKAVLVLPAAAGRAERTVELAAGETADLVSWRRAARSRAGAPWPPAELPAPRVASGTLVLVGGGRVPEEVVRRFVAAAGGKSARIVVVPIVNEKPAADDPFAATLRAAGAGHVTTLRCAHPSEATAKRLAVLADATGVWFGGGRQWRLCDVFEGTPALAAFAAVLARGGAIGGTSAGATIQGEFLVRGDPRGNETMWCEGYDRGFGFLPGCAVDQHFLRRDRTEDLRSLIASLPQLVGLGIDEDTAAIVRGAELEVVGESAVAVFDVRRADAAARKAPEPVLLRAGERWDLASGARAAAR